MAITAREVIMVFRGQNYLSSAIRRVSSDVAGLSRMQQLQVRQSMARAAADRVTMQRAANEAAIRSLKEGGARQLALQRDLDQNALAQARTRQILHERIPRRMAQVQARLTALQTKADPGSLRQTAALRAAEQQEVEAAQRAAAAENKLRDARAAATPNLKQIAGLERNAANMAQLHAKAQTELADATYGAQLQHAANADKIELEKQRLSELVTDQRIYTEQEKAQVLAGEQLNVVKQERIALLAQEEARAKVLNAQQEMANLRVRQANALIRAQPVVRFQQAARAAEHIGRIFQMVGLISAATFGY